MIVARQFIAWTRSIENPSRRVRSDHYPRLTARPDRCDARRIRSYRALRDGSRLHGIPGNKLPGYDRLVPTGRF
jgi:hypothetical protein